jgi:hypothetical protein
MVGYAPRYAGLDLKSVCTAFSEVEENFQKFLPDPTPACPNPETELPRDYVVNVIRSLDPVWLDAFIATSIAERDLKASKAGGRTVRVSEETYEALMATSLKSRKPITGLVEGGKGGLSRVFGRTKKPKRKSRAAEPPANPLAEELKQAKEDNAALEEKCQELTAKQQELKDLIARCEALSTSVPSNNDKNLPAPIKGSSLILVDRPKGLLPASAGSPEVAPKPSD